MLRAPSDGQLPWQNNGTESSEIGIPYVPPPRRFTLHHFLVCTSLHNLLNILLSSRSLISPLRTLNSTVSRKDLCYPVFWVPAVRKNRLSRKGQRRKRCILCPGWIYMQDKNSLLKLYINFGFIFN